MVRRDVLVRRSKIVGLVKEANRIEAARVLGQQAVGGRAKKYVDWKGRLLAMGRGKARRLALSWDSVKRAKRALKRTGTLRDGHGGRFASRLKIALTGADSGSSRRPQGPSHGTSGRPPPPVGPRRGALPSRRILGQGSGAFRPSEQSAQTA